VTLNPIQTAMLVASVAAGAIAIVHEVVTWRSSAPSADAESPLEEPPFGMWQTVNIALFVGLTIVFAHIWSSELAQSENVWESGLGNGIDLFLPESGIRTFTSYAMGALLAQPLSLLTMRLLIGRQFSLFMRYKASLNKNMRGNDATTSFPALLLIAILMLWNSQYIVIDGDGIASYWPFGYPHVMHAYADVVEIYAAEYRSARGGHVHVPEYRVSFRDGTDQSLRPSAADGARMQAAVELISRASGRTIKAVVDLPPKS
jgi:hypothetical protein